MAIVFLYVTGLSRAGPASGVWWLWNRERLERKAAGLLNMVIAGKSYDDFSRALCLSRAWRERRTSQIADEAGSAIRYFGSSSRHQLYITRSTPR